MQKTEVTTGAPWVPLHLQNNQGIDTVTLYSAEKERGSL